MPDVCLVVPCFNEAERLDAAVFLDALERSDRLALCFADDGSRDGTAGVLQSLAARAPDRISIVTLDVNRGKAEAVRQGILRSVADGYATVGYWDADLSTPLTEVDALLRVLDSHPNCVAAIGSRWRRLGATIERNAMRHLAGRVFATMASLVLDLPVYDSQCGAKLFTAAVAREVFAEPFLSKWCFDVEILARIAALKGRATITDAVIEVPLGTWVEVGGSKLRAVHALGMAIDLWRIHARYSRAR